MQLSIILVILQSIVGAAAVAQEPSVCRVLSVPIDFKAHSPLGKGARVLEIREKEGKIIYITTEEYVQGVGTGRMVALKSINMGKSWPWALADIHSPGVANEHGVYRSSASPEILFFSVNDDSTFLRSFDNGKSWSAPSFRINDQSKEEFALKVSGKNNYFTIFEVVELHPLDPKTVYATLIVWPLGPDAYLKLDKPHTLPGVYVSHDAGDNWVLFTEKLNNGEAIGIDPSNPQRIIGHAKDGLSISRDGGRTWTLVKQAKQLEHHPIGRGSLVDADRLIVKQFVFDSKDDSLIYMVANGGLYKSRDGGNTWCILNLGFDDIEAINNLVIDRNCPSDLYVGTWFGVFYSNDKGKSWEKIYP